MRRRRAYTLPVFDNPILVGTVTILVVIVAVYLSYIAENGLPFIPTYNIYVQVANGGELVKNADVRIGGARVGQVLTITPEPAEKGYPHPYARLGLALETSLDPLPADTHYQVRLSSVLGGQYVELLPGRAGPHVGTIPDGGTLRVASAPRADHNVPYVDLSQALDTFGPKTERGIRSIADDLGAAFAGRGTQVNASIAALNQLLPPLERLLRLFGEPSSNLRGFIDGFAGTTDAIAPVSTTLLSLLGNAATTFRALDVSALGTTLDDLPATESTGTQVLTRSLPVLRQAAEIVQALKPAAALLPTAADRLDTVLRTAPATFKLLPPVSAALRKVLRATQVLAGDPAATQVFRVLGDSDLGTFGSSAFVGIGAILNAIAPGQLSCDLAGGWVRNFASGLSSGDSTSNWLNFMPITDTNQLAPQSTPASDLHINSYPVEDAKQCQAANVAYSGDQSIDDPGTSSKAHANTAPPAGVLAEGRKAGLVP